jgi:hypothetical protein
MQPATLPPPRSLEPTRAVLPLLLLGATLGSALDAIHTHCGATEYPEPIFLRMAWWTPLLFGAAFAIGALRPWLDVILHLRPAPKPRPFQLGVTWAAFISAYFSSVLLLPWPQVSALLTLYFVIAWLASGRDRPTLLIAIAAAFLGPAVEAILVWRQAFVHLQSTFFGVPGWLPFLYLNAAVALTTLARYLSAPQARR